MVIKWGTAMQQTTPNLMGYRNSSLFSHIRGSEIMAEHREDGLSLFSDMPGLHWEHTQLALASFRTGIGKLWPACQIQPTAYVCGGSFVGTHLSPLLRLCCITEAESPRPTEPRIFTFRFFMKKSC